MPALNPIGKPFIELLTVESTNNYAMGLARAGMAQHGATVFTSDQTKGKGQRNKTWSSEKGKNIAMSVVIEPKTLPASGAFLLSMMMAVSVHAFLKTYTSAGLRIKWPNDIYWGDRKAAGILIENIWQGAEWNFAVIGIGINVNQTDFGELSTKAISLRQITGEECIPVKLAKELCAVIQRNFELMTGTPENITAAYKSQLFKRGEVVKLKKDNRVFEALIKDVSEGGELIVQHAIEERFMVGEIEWIVNGG